MTSLVLVVEDEQKIRDLVRRYLERDGNVVLSTGSGAEAIAMAADARPDLVVLDLGLPDVPGTEVAREMRAVADIPIVMLTARSDEGGPDRRLELGADDYVTKPFSPRELAATCSCGAAPPQRCSSSRPSRSATECCGSTRIAMS